MRAGLTGASLGLKGIGLLSENFWPLHDAYYRYKTMQSVGKNFGALGSMFMGMMPRGYGYKKRHRKSKKRSKVKYGGMIIPPKSLKKMFEENKCDLKY